MNRAILTLGLAMLIASGGSVADTTITPERSTKVLLSNRDVNRVVCEAGRVDDVFFSSEKGVVAETVGANVFVKLQRQKRPGDDAVLLAQEDVDLFVVCNGEVFSMIGELKPVPSQSVRLKTGAGDAKKNLALMTGMPFEKKVLYVLEHAYRDDYPESFTVHEKTEPVGALGHGFVDEIKEVEIEGVGLRLKVYQFTANAVTRIAEADFLQPVFGEHIAGVSVDSENGEMRAGERVRVFVVERRAQ